MMLWIVQNLVVSLPCRHQTEEGEALRHDDKFSYVSCWEYQGEDKDPVMLKEMLNYEFVVPQTRNYKK